MSNSPVQPFLSVPFGKQRHLLLYHSLQTSFFQTIAYSLWRKGVVGDSSDSSEGFSNIYSIFSPSRTDEADTMTNIGWSKLGRTTSKECGKMRMMCRTKLRDSTKANTSRRMYLPHTVTSINERKDVVALIRGNTLHGMLGKGQVTEPGVYI